MTMEHTTILSAEDLRSRCLELSVQATGHQFGDEHLMNLLDLGIDRPDLSDLLAELVDKGVDSTVELASDDDWELAFEEAVSSQ